MTWQRYNKNLKKSPLLVEYFLFWTNSTLFCPLGIKSDQGATDHFESSTGEIVMYQPDETIRLEVRMGEETVWLSQAQMAELFGTKRPAITKHLNNIYKCGELKEESTCSILEHMGMY